MSMLFGGKSVLRETPMKSLSDKGCKSFEAHTFERDMYRSIRELKELIGLYPMKCYAINTPQQTFNDVKLGIGDIVTSELAKNYTKKCIDLAEELCEFDTPKVVVRLGSGVKYGNLYNDLNCLKLRNESILRAERDILEIMEYIEKNNRRCEICLENTLPIEVSFEGNVSIRILGNYLDASEVVSHFMNYPRLKTTLNICNALISINMIKFNNPLASDNISNIIGIYAKTVGLVHLSCFKNLGLSADEHGILFSNKQLLSKILNDFSIYNYNTPITLELLEKAYANEEGFSNYAKQLKQIGEIIKEEKLSLTLEL